MKTVMIITSVLSFLVIVFLVCYAALMSDSEINISEIYSEHTVMSENYSEDCTVFAETVTPSQSHYISVPDINQLPELPTGCEVTSLTMVLNFFCVDIDKEDIVQNYLIKDELFRDEEEILRGPDFRYVFAGDPENEYSFGCLAPCISQTAQNVLDDFKPGFQASDITGTSFYELFYYIENDIPVIIWITLDLVDPEFITSWITYDGEEITWPTNEHCAVLSGYNYTDNTVVVNDPISGANRLSMENVKKRYDHIGQNAVIISCAK